MKRGRGINGRDDKSSGIEIRKLIFFSFFSYRQRFEALTFGDAQPLQGCCTVVLPHNCKYAGKQQQSQACVPFLPLRVFLLAGEKASCLFDLLIFLPLFPLSTPYNVLMTMTGFAIPENKSSSSSMG
jgi:hypothetical protein